MRFPSDGFDFEEFFSTPLAARALGWPKTKSPTAATIVRNPMTLTITPKAR